jgi:hypothetical protein
VYQENNEVDMYKLDLPEERNPAPKFVLVGMLALSMGVIATIFYVGFKKPESSTHTGSIQLVEVTQEVVPDKDTVIGVSNATLYIPKGVATLPGLISITTRAPNLFSNAPEPGWVRSPVVNVEYWDGVGTPYPRISFTTPAQICFQLTPDLFWQGYTQNPDEFQVQYYAEEQNPPRWLPLPLKTYPDRLQLCGQTGHLSIFALAIKEQTVIPVTGATPTLVFPSPAQSTLQAGPGFQQLYEP